MSNVALLSEISGLSFDSTFLYPLILLPTPVALSVLSFFFFSFFFANDPFSSFFLFFKENSSTFFLKEISLFAWLLY